MTSMASPAGVTAGKKGRSSRAASVDRSVASPKPANPLVQAVASAETARVLRSPQLPQSRKGDVNVPQLGLVQTPGSPRNSGGRAPAPMSPVIVAAPTPMVEETSESAALLMTPMRRRSSRSSSCGPATAPAAEWVATPDALLMKSPKRARPETPTAGTSPSTAGVLAGLDSPRASVKRARLATSESLLDASITANLSHKSEHDYSIPKVSTDHLVSQTPFTPMVLDQPMVRRAEITHHLPVMPVSQPPEASVSDKPAEVSQELQSQSAFIPSSPKQAVNGDGYQRYIQSRLGDVAASPKISSPLRNEVSPGMGAGNLFAGSPTTLQGVSPASTGISALTSPHIDPAEFSPLPLALTQPGSPWNLGPLQPSTGMASPAPAVAMGGAALVAGFPSPMYGLGVMGMPPFLVPNATAAAPGSPMTMPSEFAGCLSPIAQQAGRSPMQARDNMYSGIGSPSRASPGAAGVWMPNRDPSVASPLKIMGDNALGVTETSTSVLETTIQTETQLTVEVAATASSKMAFKSPGTPRVSTSKVALPIPTTPLKTVRTPRMPASPKTRTPVKVGTPSVPAAETPAVVRQLREEAVDAMVGKVMQEMGAMAQPEHAMDVDVPGGAPSAPLLVETTETAAAGENSEEGEIDESSGASQEQAANAVPEAADEPEMTAEVEVEPAPTMVVDDEAASAEEAVEPEPTSVGRRTRTRVRATPAPSVKRTNRATRATSAAAVPSLLSGDESGPTPTTTRGGATAKRTRSATTASAVTPAVMDDHKEEVVEAPVRRSRRGLRSADEVKEVVVTNKRNASKVSRANANKPSLTGTVPSHSRAPRPPPPASRSPVPHPRNYPHPYAIAPREWRR